MKSVQLQEQQQPNSMDSYDSGGCSITQSEYAYRPLTTKHRRAGSTGTTGDEEYTTDEDELYGDEADCCAAPGSVPHAILVKSDLARAATDLFGYDTKRDDEVDEPTSLFEDEDDKFCRQSSTKPITIFNYNESPLPRGVLARRRASGDSDKSRVSPARSIQQTSDRRPQQPEEKSLAEINGDICANYEEDYGKSTNADIPSTTETTQQLVNGTSEIPKDSNDNSDPPSPCVEHWGRAVTEVKEQTITKLQEELRRAHEELKLKDEEVSRLSRIRQDVEAELEELTASLFQEAHNMVREANQRQATAERLLEESRMKSEVLAAEVAALKTLVLTSTPARPNPHLHPQIAGGYDDAHQQGIFAKKHRRSPSHFNLKYGRENSPPDSPMREQRPSLPCDANHKEVQERDLDKEREDRDRDKKKESREREKETRESGVEVDPRVHNEFLRWKENPCVDKSDPFIQRIFREDIDLCLDFPNIELGARVRQAVLDGIIFVEAVSDKAKLGFPKKCALLEAPRQCHYRMRMGDQENQWHCISQICRNRIIAVCDFLNYLRYIERGLVKSSIHDIYWEITRLRKEMVLARLGLALSA